MASQIPLRLWPGVALAVLQLLSFFVWPLVLPEKDFLGMFGVVISGFLIVDRKSVV